MIPFRQVLFPVDFSEDGRALLPYVKDLVQRFASHLTLLHVFEGHPQKMHEVGSLAELLEDFRQLEEDRLRGFAREHFPEIAPEIVLQEGEPGVAIRETIQQRGIDLVMMPTKGRGTFQRFLLGSVTAQVLHDASCPVFTGIHASLEATGEHVPYRSIVCALGLDPGTPGVLKTAGALAHAYEAKLWFIHVVETPPMSIEVDFEPYRKELIDTADMELRGLMRDANVEAGLVVCGGSRAERVTREAIEQKADLLITGRGQDQGKIAQLFSQLYEIVRESPCPVLSL